MLPCLGALGVDGATPTLSRRLAPVRLLCVLTCSKWWLCAVNPACDHAIEATTTAWLTEPCTFFDPQLLPGAGALKSFWAQNLGGLAGGAFRNVPAVWNAYTLGYVRLGDWHFI